MLYNTFAFRGLLYNIYYNICLNGSFVLNYKDQLQLCELLTADNNAALIDNYSFIHFFVIVYYNFSVNNVILKKSNVSSEKSLILYPN